MNDHMANLRGLTTDAARQLQEQYGRNELSAQKKKPFIKQAIHILCEPMFLLLLVTAIIYFILGEPADGAVMLLFVTAVISIDIMQEWKTDRTLRALKELSDPLVTVIRDSRMQTIASRELVPGDLMMIEEGVKIPADGLVVDCNDLCVDESLLTGESEGVWKTSIQKSQNEIEYWRKDYCYAGTMVTQGFAIVLVKQIGNQTEYGKIGADVAVAPEHPTPLQRQTRGLVKLCTVIAISLLLLVGMLTFLNLGEYDPTDRIIESILSGITLAMGMIPEEFPVILAVVLSMGAWRLARKQSLVRRLPSVETLGAVTVLCVDKTGTITTNQMTVQDVWSLKDDTLPLCEISGLACETNAYDPMEKAILSYCDKRGLTSEQLFNGQMVKEYSFTNELKMMGHTWRRGEEIVLAAKGCPEGILALCLLTEEELVRINNRIMEMSLKGQRVLAVGKTIYENEESVPDSITDCHLTFYGLIGLTDPPREGIEDDIALCKKAGIRVVMITGDNGTTAMSIADQIGMQHCESIITGDMLDKMSDAELQERVHDVNIFSRVVPKHKMRIVKVFQENGEIVAMTGDGVNDAPALKHADIGIAMGKRGSQVAREASDLILMDDNFTTIVETVKDGRRIYDNIRKAVGYVISIHMPIALSALLAPLLGIPPIAVLLLPAQVVLLELLIDPTCSIVLERQPAESNIMERKPRKQSEPMVTCRLLIKSIIQGVVIFSTSFMAYLLVLDDAYVYAREARAMGLTILMCANLLLVLVNSSESDSVFYSIKRLVKDKVMWGVMILTITMIAVILYSPLHSFLKLAPLGGFRLLLSLGIALASVLWYEIVKWIKRKKNR